MKARMAALLVGPWLSSGAAAPVPVPGSGSSPCIERTVEEAFDANQIVLVGRVTSLTPVDASGHSAPLSEAVGGLYRVEVVEEFKGEGRAEYDMMADLPLPPSRADEVYINGPFVLEIGREYLLFGWNDPLGVDPCASMPLEDGEEAVESVRQMRDTPP